MFFRKKTGGIGNSDWLVLENRIHGIQNAFSELEMDAGGLSRYAVFRLKEFAEGIDLPKDLLEFPIELPDGYAETFEKDIKHFLTEHYFDCNLDIDKTKDGYHSALAWCAEKEKAFLQADTLIEAVSKLCMLFLHLIQGLPPPSKANDIQHKLEDGNLGDKRETISQFHLVLDVIREDTQGVFFTDIEEAFLYLDDLAELPLIVALTKYCGMPDSLFSFLNQPDL